MADPPPIPPMDTEGARRWYGETWNAHQTWALYLQWAGNAARNGDHEQAILYLVHVLQTGFLSDILECTKQCVSLIERLEALELPTETPKTILRKWLQAANERVLLDQVPPIVP